MKRMVQLFIATVLLGSITIQADPFELWDWVPAALYENGNPIPTSDVQTYTLYCNTTPGEQGPPYDVGIALDDPGAPPSIEDMAPVVQGRVGTYECVATQRSTAYNTESGYSNVENFIATSADLGFVPQPPTLLTSQTQ